MAADTDSERPWPAVNTAVGTAGTEPKGQRGVTDSRAEDESKACPGVMNSQCLVYLAILVSSVHHVY
jgi:hypothetical protein